MRDHHDLHYISNWVAGFTKFYPATARVLTMFEVYQKNEVFLPGHTASDTLTYHEYMKCIK